MRTGLVRVAVSKRKLVAQGKTELTEPAVVGSCFTNPDATGVVGMGLLVGTRRKAAWIRHPMGAVEKLGGFKNHLYDMLVAMMSRCNAGVEVKEEDVHLGCNLFAGPSLICFD